MMFHVLLVLAGCALASFGFLVMRNPMCLASISPRTEGYYQRMVLDRYQRIRLRMVGMLMSFFGLVFLVGALNGLLRSKALDSLSEGLLALLWFSFIACISFGVIRFIVQIVRGRTNEDFQNWFRALKIGMKLGPIAVYPPITPRMKSESKAFTIAYCFLVGLTVGIALLVHK
jgi:hypothetical protein